MNKQKKQSKVLTIILAIALVLLAIELLWLVFAHFGASNPSNDNVPTTTETVLQEEQESMPTEPIETEEVVSMPWEKTNAKQPVEYTWEEYQLLTGEQQKAFRDYLGDEYEQWLNTVREQAEVNPWDEPGAKQPAEYTREEYEALTIAQQMAFQKYLGETGFNAWLEKAQSQTGKNPWEQSGSKQPADYTWAEFEALTAEQQMAFQSFLGVAGFETWLNKVQNQLAKNPWDEPGAKQPADYTWEEYEALTAAQQMAFQQYLGTQGFEAWLNKVHENPVENPWEKPGAKQPKDYTWAEFEALTAEQQMAFQNYLGEAGFETWLSKAQSQTTSNPWEKPGAKQPADYTWEEFEALTGAQQMAFQKYLGEEGFDAWLNKVQNQTEKNPWDEPGAKQPEDYTWEEFEALTGAQQMAFQDYLGEAGFEAWLNRVLGS